MTRAEVLDLYYRTLDWKKNLLRSASENGRKKRLRPASIESYEKIFT